MRPAWLGLGGNVGNVQAAMASALRLLNETDGFEVEAVSPIYKTPPWGVVDQPWFLNCCARVVTDLSPEQLLDACQAAERAGKRERIVRWGPRTIDIDILVFDGVEQDEERLTLPHPRMLERAFVLVPLADIAAQLIMKGKTVRQWADIIDRDGLEKLDEATDWWQ